MAVSFGVIERADITEIDDIAPSLVGAPKAMGGERRWRHQNMHRQQVIDC